MRAPHSLPILLILSTCLNARGQSNYDSIIDIHVHLWDLGKSPEQYINANRNKNIRLGGIVIIQKPGDLKSTRHKNDEIISLSKLHTNIIPVCSVHPYDGDSALVELKRLKTLGVKLIKLHPITQNFDIEDERVSRVAEAAGNLGIVVLIDSYTFFQRNNVEKLLYLAYRNRNTNFIFAHLGGPEFEKFGFHGFLRTTNSWFANNMWFDISATINILADSPYKDELEWTIRTIGIDKILFGSDFPQFSVDETIKSLDKLELSNSEKEQILYSNAKKLLNLD